MSSTAPPCSVGPARLSSTAPPYKDDRALVFSSVDDNGKTYGALRQVQLSTGAVFNFGEPVGASVVASPTGDFLAENSIRIGDVEFTEIHGVTTGGGDVIGRRLPPQQAVIALSGNGRLALVDTGSVVDVVDWFAGKVLWHSAGSSIDYAVQPGGDAFAIAQPGDPGCVDPCARPPATITIVNGDGTAHVLPGKYVPLW